MMVPITSLDFKSLSTRASGRKRRRRRSVHADHEGERQGALKQVEELLSLATGMDGHACLLRVICEASHTPSHMVIEKQC